MIRFLYAIPVFLLLALSSCRPGQEALSAKIYETSAAGSKLQAVEGLEFEEADAVLTLVPDSVYQQILGFGGSFTESSASLLNRMSEEKRQQIIDAYFGPEGSRYSLTRTHINSCDFSLGNYSYAPVEGDSQLEHFSIDEDRDDIIPMIKAAMAVSKEGFKIISSPWTAPPWMKDNHDWRGGKLLPEYREAWALFFSKYISAYREEGIPIWGITVENEPLGNSSNWESMHYTAEEMADFIGHYLGPRLEADSNRVVLLAYDQNRDRALEEWAGILYADESAAPYINGFAVHWYESTNFSFGDNLARVHAMAPGKSLVHTEACVDAEVPHWKDDEAWYWEAEATDWGWDWAAPEDKQYHPKYVPVYRYARDIIGSLNNWVEGWVDWNMVLDRQGGPNWAHNWAVAPVIVDPEQDEVYFTPLYYTLAHFSRFIRPGAVRIGTVCNTAGLELTAVKNPDGSFVTVVLNTGEVPRNIRLKLGSKELDFRISEKAIQTIVIDN